MINYAESRMFTKEEWLENVRASLKRARPFTEFRLRKLLTGNPTDCDDNVPKEWAQQAADEAGIQC